MSSKYFEKLPIINYNGKFVRDLSRSDRIPNDIKNSPYAFYPYQLTRGERPDQIADGYYGDVYMSWLVYMANQVVDPYYDWHMHDQAFVDHIIDKYGSVAYAQRKIMFYRNNWYDDDTKLTILQYQALTRVLKQYWSPVNDEVGYPMYYVRKQLDRTTNTNTTLIFSLYGGYTSHTLQVGDLITAYDGTTQNAIGNAEVSYVTPTSVTLINVTLSAPTYFNMTFTADLQNPTRTGVFDPSTSQCPFQNISDSEWSYWGPVTAWDVEMEKNVQNGNILLVDANLASAADKSLTDTLGS